MRRFLNANVGKTAELIFSVLGLREKVTGEIVGVSENAVILDVNGDLNAGPVDSILYVRLFRAPDASSASSENSETQANPSGGSKNGQIFSPSLNAQGRKTQTIF